MRFSNLFGRTLRESPSDAEMVSHRLSIRAGLIRRLSTGIYSFLPLGWRVMRRLKRIIREEMDAVDGQELLMPIVHPAEAWRATGRYDAPTPGPALLRFTDRSGHDMVLAMTHEEVVTGLARQEIRSYRQLPTMVYQIQTKFRDEPRSRGGVVRAREFVMKDAYSFHADEGSLDAYYPRIYQAYLNILGRCGLEAIPVEADAGMMGGSTSHEFMVVNEAGEDTLIICPNCKYAANAQAARFAKTRLPEQREAPMERVATPDATTIEAVAHLLGVERRQTLKAVFYNVPESGLVFVVIRGDLEVNETKLRSMLGDVELEAAGKQVLEDAGIVAGYASPVGTSGVRVVADDSILTGSNFVAGANEAGFHLRNVNYPRDFAVDTIGDVALARNGDGCAVCGSPLVATRGIEVGHLFKLGTRYSKAVGATFLDREGVAKPLVMGCYGIGLGRLMACIIEQHHDDRGIIWPVSVAPFQVHLVCLSAHDPAVDEAAELLYRRLTSAGYEVLLDDRPERAGVKFNDADLIGIPVRLTVSRRTTAEGCAEVKGRWDDTASTVADAEVETEIANVLANAPTGFNARGAIGRG